MWRRVVLAACVLLATPVVAQTAERELPNGKELVVVYVGATSCGPCLRPDMKAAVSRMKELLSQRAAAQHYAFSAVGVSTDWAIATGTQFLADNGAFDQVVIGGNWTNLAVEHYVWRDSTAIPAMPQVVVLERTVTPGERVEISPARAVRRIVGDDIVTWVAAGAPVTLAPAVPPQSR